MQSRLNMLLTLCATLLLSGCIVSRHPAGIASSTGPLPRGYTALDAAEKASCSHRIMFLPITGKDDTDQIVSELLNEKGADVLVGVTVEHEQSIFALPFYGTDCTIVKGLVAKKPQ